mgnify:CR=1 FL=1
MFPPFTTAANFVPSAEEAIPCHSFPPPGLVVFSVQVAPLSDDVHKLPPNTPATNFVPSADDARANQDLFGSEALCNRFYIDNIDNTNIFFPLEKVHEFNTYHTFVIQVDRRDELKNFLKKRGIDTTIHYPIPIHLQTASKYLGYKKGSFPEAESQANKILTLPIHQHLKQKDILRIAKTINEFLK